jgi:hypothetical protein
MEQPSRLFILLQILVLALSSILASVRDDWRLKKPIEWRSYPVQREPR